MKRLTSFVATLSFVIFAFSSPALAQSANVEYLPGEYLAQAQQLANSEGFDREVRQIQEQLDKVDEGEANLRKLRRKLGALTDYVKQNRLGINRAIDVSTAVYFARDTLKQEAELLRATTKRERNQAHASIVQSVLAHLSTQSESKLGGLLREHLAFALKRWEDDTGPTSTYQSYRDRSSAWLK